MSGILGVILAGGRARRMGSDKTLAMIAGRTLIEHAVARLAPQCAGLLLSTGEPGRFEATGLPIVHDEVPGAGPLAGLLAALDWASGHGFAQVASVPADAPFLPRDFVPRLEAARAREKAVIACAASAGRRHPVAALWPVGIRADLRQALVVEGVRKVGAYAARHAVATVEWPAEPIDLFFNVNTPDDLAEARRMTEAGAV